ncbi:zinc finger transcription factor sma, putative [Ichthyophthirius multifiliis]|uniref:Zinc finger transcription factor sma, putative n=1 Tax=Ichthyophthirius multifiliis TaxID=5932 RepID=G0R3V9_ICHMU|nr:zinc finger transcription factor sma, putative [Ichthyophthirius multifiliis]EGR27835.1 zinc finger transcription factor sma, putative [Ichthyophthirius multifiliis]|eukprot:XP_004027180.1 zinc finger transcription factor sma, putative [Ichthyophthirius multifiliis]
MSNQQQNFSHKWDWIPCNYSLKTEVKKKMTVWNLQPAIVLTNPLEDGPDPHVKLFIDTEKSLQYSEDLGWNWHKSWNLPNISVRLEIKDVATGDSLQPPKNLYVIFFSYIFLKILKKAHLFAIKAVIDQPDNFHLVDIGMKGNTKIELINGQAFFQAIKFMSTSYNNEGVKFHLVLCIYIMNEDEEIPKMLNATISPPIFVDSRKSARDSQVILEKKMSSYVDPFLPENLDKTFVKRENKKKNDNEINISNNSDGLFNYLTAPNIRHKVKHPLFLALKFSQCTKLYYNNTQLDKLDIDQLLEQLQTKITKDHSNQQKSQSQVKIKIENKPFVLQIQESQDKYRHNKIKEALDQLECPSLELTNQPIPQQFQERFVDITNGNQEGIQELINVYKKTYQNLLAIAKSITQREYGDDIQ